MCMEVTEIRNRNKKPNNMNLKVILLIMLQMLLSMAITI